MRDLKLMWAACWLALSALPAAAQVASEGGAELEQIVVTAQKRSENAQKVPISITGFTASALSEHNITSLQGLGNLTPNVTLDAGSPFSGSTAVLSASIRGIGQDDFAFNLDPGVGVYIDGVYLARTIGANADLLDVERVEVLKGPQGTLFGRNSVGGAISVVTRQPSDQFGFRGEVIGGSFNRLDVHGTVDLPLISDKVLSTFTFAENNREGYLHRIPFDSNGFVTEPLAAFPRSGFDTSDTEGGENQWTIRSKILWHASDQLDVTVMGDYLHQDQPGAPNTLLRTEAGPTSLAAIYNACINAPSAVLPAVPGANLQTVCRAPRPYGIGGPLADANTDANPYNNRLTYNDQFVTGNIDESYSTAPDFSRLTNWGISTTAVYTLAPDMSLKSITAYRQLHWAAGTDSDASPLAMQDVGFLTNQRQISEELQLTGKAVDRRLDYVVGLYYFKETGNSDDIINLAEGLSDPEGNNLFSTQSYAAFTHLNFQVNDAFSVTLGGRYTREKKRLLGGQRDPTGFGYEIGLGLLPGQITDADRIAAGYPDPSDPLRLYPAGWNEQTFSNFSPLVGLEYTPLNDVMLYASFSEGYKTGGWTTRLTAASLTAPSFNPEKARTYEVGVKSELFEHRVRLNEALFFTDYDDIQLNQLVGVSPTIRNAGDAQIYGSETEMQLVASDALLIGASVGYLHDRYTRKDVGADAGDSLPKTPRWKASLGPHYDINVANGGELVAIVNFTYTTSLFNDTENSPIIERHAVSMLDASVQYQEPGKHWSITAGGTNILDRRYIVTGQNQTGVGFASATFNAPAEWYVKIGVKF